MTAPSQIETSRLHFGDHEGKRGLWKACFHVLRASRHPTPGCHDPPRPVHNRRELNLRALRVDKKFRTYGPEDQRMDYHKRPHIEAVYSFLKTQYSLANNKVRGLRNVASYALYSLLCLVLNREAAENIDRADKAVSPTYFNT